MSFVQAVRTCLGHPALPGTRSWASLAGRAPRSEFWWFMLFTALVTLVASVLGGVVATVVLVALLGPIITVAARRLHDVGRSGPWLMLFFTVVGIPVLLVLFCLPTGPDNEFGPRLEGGSGAPAAAVPD